MVAIDNVPTGMDSGALAAMLTADTYSDRALGGSEMKTVPVRCVWAATALNPTLTGELARRCVSIRLEPAEEAPWERGEWRHPDLLGWVREHRPELVWACLTLWQAWLAAGRPLWRAETMGSYERWAQVMGGVLEVAGIPGLLGNREAMWAATETELPELRVLAENWWGQFGDQPVRVLDLLQLCRQRRVLSDRLRGARDRAKSLGCWLRRHDGRVVAVSPQLRLQLRLRPKDRSGSNLWALVRPGLPALPADSQQDSQHQELLSDADTGLSAGSAGSTFIPPAYESTVVHTHMRVHAHGGDMHSLHSQHSLQTPREPCPDGARAAGSSACSPAGSPIATPPHSPWGTCEHCSRTLTSPHGGTGLCAACLDRHTRQASLL